MLYRLRDQTLTPRARRPEDGRRRIAGGFAVSLLLHTVILAALLVRLKWEREPEPLPPPAAVSMIFEGGHATAVAARGDVAAAGARSAADGAARYRDSGAVRAASS
jgi:hypothetical protein